MRRQRQGSGKLWLSFLGLMGGLVLLLVFLAGRPGNSQTAILLDTLSPSDHAKGAGAVTLIEYGDYQCPACAAYEPLVARVIAEMGDKVTVAYRNFPLRQIHRNADITAQAAEAAALQGKFWEMNHLLYRRQAEWDDRRDVRELVKDYARELGLDEARFAQDLHSEAVKEKIESDLRSGLAAGVKGTPTFFLNGKEIQNPKSYEEFKAAIEHAMEQK